MKKFKSLLTITVSILIIFTTVFVTYAHPGSTDEFGGHVDWEYGDYHYHHGYPAHYHDNGECPYDFVDQTDHTNHGGTSTNDYDYQYGDRTQYLPDEQYDLITPSENKKAETTVVDSDSSDDTVVLLTCVPGVLALGTLAYSHKKEKARQEAERKRKYEEEKAHYTQLYANKNILDLVNAPAGAFIDKQGFPHQAVKNDDIFVVYVSPKKPRVFHGKKSCSKNLVQKNYIELKNKYGYPANLPPCKKCKPAIPDIKWYDEYLHIKHIKEKYKIE